MTHHRRSPRPLAGALLPLRDGWAPETLLAEAQRVWRDAVGEMIAGEAGPVSERAGVLTVSCSSAVWANELDLMALEIIARLNEHLGAGKVRRLRCITAT